jgi:hypothetical protein
MWSDTLRKGEVSGNKDIDGAQREIGEAVGKGGVGESVGSNVDKSFLRGNV